MTSARRRCTGAVTIWIYTFVLVMAALPSTSCILQRRTGAAGTGTHQSVSEFLDVLEQDALEARLHKKELRDTIPHDKLPPDKVSGSTLIRAIESDPRDRAASGPPDQAHFPAGIQESSSAAKLTMVPAHSPQLRNQTSPPAETSKTQVITVITESLMLLISLGCFLFTLFIGLRLQLLNPRWDYLQSAWWIGFGIASMLLGQTSSLLSNQVFHRSRVHLPSWMARCVQDECVGLITLSYLVRIQTWRSAWEELVPYSNVYERVRGIPRAGNCAPSAMLCASISALLLLALNIPVAINLVWMSSTLWPNISVPDAPNVVRAIDIFFPYAVLGLSACLVLHTLTSIRLKHDKPNELCHEIWVSCAVLCVGAILHIIFDGSWLLAYDDALRGGGASKQSKGMPLFREEVTATWCVALHLNQLVTTFFLWQSQARCQPLPRPFDAAKVDALFEPSPLGTIKLEHESLDPGALDTDAIDMEPPLPEAYFSPQRHYLD